MKYKQLRKGVSHENLKLWQQNNTFRYYNTTLRIRIKYGVFLDPGGILGYVRGIRTSIGTLK